MREEAGGRRQDEGSKREEAGERRQEEGGRRKEAGGRRQEEGGKEEGWTEVETEIEDCAGDFTLFVMHKVPLVTIVDTPSDQQFLCFPCYHGHLYHPVQENVDWMGGTITKQSI